VSGLLVFRFGGVVAGAVIEDGRVVDAAPVVRKTLGMTLEQIRAQFPNVEWRPDGEGMNTAAMAEAVAKASKQVGTQKSPPSPFARWADPGHDLPAPKQYRSLDAWISSDGTVRVGNRAIEVVPASRQGVEGSRPAMIERIWLLWNEPPLQDVATILWTKKAADRAIELGRRVEGPFALEDAVKHDPSFMGMVERDDKP
jgi:hypothetical protein